MARHFLKSKQGFFLTLLSISIIAVMFMMFQSTPIEFRASDESSINRVQQVNSYVLALEDIYLEKALRASSIRAIGAMIEELSSGPLVRFADDFSYRFNETLNKGELYGVAIPSMVGDRFTDKIIVLDLVGEETWRLRSNFTVVNVGVSQDTPWYLTIQANLTMHLDADEVTYLSNLSVISQLYLQDIEDPYPAISSEQAFRTHINISPIKPKQWNASHLQDMVYHGWYTHLPSSPAPSYIMRFENDTSNSSCCGIESVVDPTEPGVPFRYDNYADFNFWNGSFTDRCDQLWNLTDSGGAVQAYADLHTAYPELKFTLAHTVLYNLNLSYMERIGLPCP